MLGAITKLQAQQNKQMDMLCMKDERISCLEAQLETLEARLDEHDQTLSDLEPNHDATTGTKRRISVISNASEVPYYVDDVKKLKAQLKELLGYHDLVKILQHDVSHLRTTDKPVSAGTNVSGQNITDTFADAICQRVTVGEKTIADFGHRLVSQPHLAQHSLAHYDHRSKSKVSFCRLN